MPISNTSSLRRLTKVGLPPQVVELCYITEELWEVKDLSKENAVLSGASSMFLASFKRAGKERQPRAAAAQEKPEPKAAKAEAVKAKASSILGAVKDRQAALAKDGQGSRSSDGQESSSGPSLSQPSEPSDPEHPAQVTLGPSRLAVAPWALEDLWLPQDGRDEERKPILSRSSCVAMSDVQCLQAKEQKSGTPTSFGSVLHLTYGSGQPCRPCIAGLQNLEGCPNKWLCDRCHMQHTNETRGSRARRRRGGVRPRLLQGKYQSWSFCGDGATTWSLAAETMYEHIPAPPSNPHRSWSSMGEAEEDVGCSSPKVGTQAWRLLMQTRAAERVDEIHVAPPVVDNDSNAEADISAPASSLHRSWSSVEDAEAGVPAPYHAGTFSDEAEEDNYVCPLSDESGQGIRKPPLSKWQTTSGSISTTDTLPMMGAVTTDTLPTLTLDALPGVGTVDTLPSLMGNASPQLADLRHFARSRGGTTAPAGTTKDNASTFTASNSPPVACDLQPHRAVR